MSSTLPPFQQIVITAHPDIPMGLDKAKKIADFFNARGIEARHDYLYDENLQMQVAARDIDLVIALGGDGTMLRAGRLCAPYEVPILGINMGKFGFLMEVKLEEWQTSLQHLLEGNFWLEKRMLLCVEQWHNGKSIAQWQALNEVVIGRGETVRPVHLDTNVDERYLTTYVADGLIAATSTGSTAYALAAGGPILPPELRNILLVPVAPHLSIDRAIVLAEGSTVSITVHTDHQAMMSIDGQQPIQLADGDCIQARASEHTVQFVRIQDPGYFYRNLTPHMYNNPATKKLS